MEPALGPIILLVICTIFGCLPATSAIPSSVPLRKVNPNANVPVLGATEKVSADTACSPARNFRAYPSQIYDHSGKLQCNPQDIFASKTIVDSITNGVARVVVGFPITNNRFVKQFDIALNVAQLRPIFVHHFVEPHPIPKKVSNEFRTDGIYPENTKSLYDNFRTQICTNLLHLSDPKCTASIGTEHLTRGHLAPASDFKDHPQQAGTYTYANMAPQWGSVNKEHWADIEKGIRALSMRSGKILDVVTGTLGQMRMDSSSGVSTALYLGDGGTMPVPEVFYKIVFERTTKLGVVFVMLNNPWPKTAQIDHDWCVDRYDEMKWPSFIPTTRGEAKRRETSYLEKGYVYVCSVGEFLEKHRTETVDLPPVLRDNQFGFMSENSV